ncbi:hypothetical protein ACH42_00635 [Endozoicomonas sp. (ex Bugula neritina AB1)]|nr:hypothetical protein ACH42_00635 [Endozoicomonas sp. (ex Bugula neritina AB1)]
MNTKQQRGVRTLILLTLSVVGLLSISWLGDFFRELQSDTEVHPTQVVVSYCDVAATCSTRLQDATVDLRIEPVSMPVLSPLNVVVTLRGLEARQVTLEFSGRDMPMNIDPVLLSRNDYGVEHERYTGTAMISFCSSDEHMVWLARVNIKTKTEVQTVVFELDTSRS